MSPPIIEVSNRWQRVLKLFALLYILWQIRKLIRKLRALSNSKHSQTQYHNRMISTPAENLFPQYFESSTKSGLWIFHRAWVLPLDAKTELDLIKPLGVVIISHGLAEHIQRYEHLARVLNSKGFACYGMDHQGHGLSDGDRSYVEIFDDYVSDLICFSEGVAEEYKKYDIPIFLLGHSMGGLIASYAAMQYNFSGGVILSSPFFGVSPQSDIGSQWSIVDKTVRFLSDKLPKLQCIALDNKGLSHDPKVFYRLQRDALHHTDMVCIRTIKEIVDAANNLINAQSANVKYPYLLFGGACDPLCDPNKWKIFHGKTNTIASDKEMNIFSGLFHECLNETQPHQQKVIQHIVQWLLKRTQIYHEENEIEDKSNIQQDSD